MLYKTVTSRIYLWFGLIFAGISYLHPMNANQQYEDTNPEFQYPIFYTKKETKLIDLILKKIITMIVILKDDKQQPLQEIDQIDVSSIPAFIRVFLPLPRTIASIKPKQFLDRFIQYTNQDPSCYVIALIYVNRFIDKAGIPNAFNQFSFYRIFLTAMVLAIKWFENEEKILDNKYYAKVGGIKVEDLDILEINFIDITKFNLWISKEEFRTFVSKLREEFYDFVPWLKAELDNFVSDLNNEVDDFVSEFKKLKLETC